MKCMDALGYAHKLGKPPPSGLELYVQDLLESD